MINLYPLKQSIIWTKSIKLVLSIYKETSTFPNQEKYTLAQHLRKTAISIPSNIAEGLMRRTRSELCQFAVIAKGSAGELLTQLIIAEEMGYIEKKRVNEIKEELIEIIKILYSIIKSTSRK